MLVLPMAHRVDSTRARRRLVIGAAVAAIICLALPASASGAAALSANPEGPLDIAAVDRYIQSEIAGQRIPGLALSIVRGDRIVHTRASAKRTHPGER